MSAAGNIGRANPSQEPASPGRRLALPKVAVDIHLLGQREANASARSALGESRYARAIQDRQARVSTYRRSIAEQHDRVSIRGDLDRPNRDRRAGHPEPRFQGNPLKALSRSVTLLGYPPGLL